MVRLLTVGHGTIDGPRFTALVIGAGIGRVIDVRTKPGSKRYPWFGRAELERWLPDAGVAYGWEPSLGGFRSPVADSPNVALRNRAFRGYADHMAGPEFAEGFAAVLGALGEAGDRDVAVMCSESLWWKCHRRLLADTATMVHDLEVLHLAHDGTLAAHRVTDAARLGAAGHLVYDRDAAQLALDFAPPGPHELGGTARSGGPT